jgi:hypothetical protein
MEKYPDLNVALLHAGMHNKKGEIVTASLTMIDVHDLARSARTYGVNTVYVAHPAETLRKLSLKLKSHWEVGFGATYNPNRKQALEIINIVTSLDEAIDKIKEQSGKMPKLIATSAKEGRNRVNFKEMKELLFKTPEQPYLLLLGTGWGMSAAILDRADYFLEPVQTVTGYNHLSVRSACAIMLDRLLG